MKSRDLTLPSVVSRPTKCTSARRRAPSSHWRLDAWSLEANASRPPERLMSKLPLGTAAEEAAAYCAGGVENSDAKVGAEKCCRSGGPSRMNLCIAFHPGDNCTNQQSPLRRGSGHAAASWLSSSWAVRQRVNQSGRDIPCGSHLPPAMESP